MADDNDNENENGEEPKLLGDISGVLQDVFADLFPPPEPEPEEGEDENGEQKDDAEKQTEAEEPVDEKGPEETEAKDDGAEKNNALSESGDPATEADDVEEDDPLTTGANELERALQAEAQEDEIHIQTRHAQIDDELNKTISGFKQLEEYLEERRLAAEAEDLKEAEFLEKWHLEVKEDFPIGPSRLKLDNNKLKVTLEDWNVHAETHTHAHAEFGGVGALVVNARTILAHNEKLLLAKSGNVPLSGAYDIIKDSEIAPKYLNTTGSMAKRAAMVADEREAMRRRKPHDTTLGKQAVATTAGQPDGMIKKVRSKKAEWKQKASVLAMAQNKKVIERMKAATSMLPNPRNIDTRGAKGDGKMVWHHPDEVRFSEYEAGGGAEDQYSAVVEFTNVSAIQRRLRILPPTTVYFKKTALTFPRDKTKEAQGQDVCSVAPGMTCSLTIYFNPDTAGQYSDVLKCLSETISFEIPLKAYRTPPKLSLPPTLDCGHCLVGGRVRKRFRCKNSNGEGLFRVFASEEWPDTKPVRFHWDEVPVPSSDALTIRPFRVSPSEFRLKPGEQTIITVDFWPTEDRASEAGITLVCDNCDITRITLTAVGSMVTFQASRLGKTELQLQDGLNLTGFPDTLLLGSCVLDSKLKQRLTFSNAVPIPVRYEWDLAANRPNKKGRIKDVPCAPDNDNAVWQVTPRSGVCDSLSSVDFTFLFNPNTTGVHNLTDLVEGKAMLRVHEVPAEAIRGTEKVPEGFPTTSGNQEDSELGLVSVPVHNMRLVGRNAPYDVVADPPLLQLRKLLLITQTRKQTITLSNRSAAPAPFKWEPLRLNTEPHPKLQVAVSPSEGVIAAHSTLSVSLSVTGFTMGDVDASMVCVVAGESPQVTSRVEVGVRGRVTGPDLRFTVPDLNFGIVASTKSKELRLPFVNNSKVPARWSVVPVLTANSDDDTDIRCEPNGGLLQPMRSTEIVVRCRAGIVPQVIRRSVELQVVHSPPTYVRLRVDVQQVKLILNKNHLKLGNSYVGLAATRRINMTNPTSLPANFRWSLLTPSTDCKIRFSQPKGVVAPGATLDLEVTFTPLNAVRFDLTCVCTVESMSEPIGLRITSLARGLVVSYQHVEQEQAEEIMKSYQPGSTYTPAEADLPADVSIDRVPALPFGPAVPIFNKRTLYLCIRNHSGVHTSFDIQAKKYPPATMEPEFKPPSTATLNSTSRANKKRSKLTPLPPGTMLLGAAHEKAERFRSAFGRKKMNLKQQLQEGKDLLRAGNGLAFIVDIDNNDLPPWSARIVKVSCLADIPGRYRDQLISSVRGLNEVRINASAGVVGAPLALEEACVGLDCLQSPALLKFGQLLHSSPSSRRVVRVRNTSPMIAHLRWKVTHSPDEDDPIFDISLKVNDGKDPDADIVTVCFVDHELPPIPYRITPMDAKVHPRSISSFEVQFDPPSEAALSRACLVGNVTWDDANKNVTEKTRLQKKVLQVANALKAVLPLARPSGPVKLPAAEDKMLLLNVSGTTITPRLTVNRRDKAGPSDSDGNATTRTGQVKFTTWATRPKKHPSKQRMLTLTNHTDGPISFSVDSENPFVIASAKCSTANTNPLAAPSMKSLSATRKENLSTAHDADRVYTLPPDENLQVSLQFHWVLPHDETVPRPLQYTNDGTFFIRYTNGDIQEIPTHATVLRPTVDVFPATHDFGLLRAGHAKPLTVHVGNPTKVDAVWELQHVPSQEPEDRPAVFSIGKMSGVLKGPTIPVSSGMVHNRPPDGLHATQLNQIPTQFQVTFTPEHNVQYRSTFRFMVRGGNSFDVTFSGEGSYDEEFE